MALKYSEQKVILRSVELRNLPQEVLAVSPHQTVPSLVITENKYMDESWDIVKWAIQKNDPQNWLGENNKYLQAAEMLVETNDFSFKQDLDHYKYAERHPEHSTEYYRLRCEAFIDELNETLEENDFLVAPFITTADIAIFPFIRQFSMVDKVWFGQSPYWALQRWLATMLDTHWFNEAFKKHDTWQPGSENIYV